MLREEGLSAEQTGFLTVGEREQDAVAGFGFIVQRARDFEQRCNAGAVVSGARREVHRIVVRHQQNPGWLLSVDSREHVLHAAAYRPLEAAGDGLLYFRREPQLGEPLHEARLHPHVGRTSDRMRSLVAQQPRQLFVRAHCGEDLVRRIGAERGR